MQNIIALFLALLLSGCALPRSEEHTALALFTSYNYVKTLAPDGCHYRIGSESPEKWFCEEENLTHVLNTSGITRAWIEKRINRYGSLDRDDQLFALLKLYQCQEDSASKITCNVPLNQRLTQFISPLATKNNDGTTTYEIYRIHD